MFTLNRIAVVPWRKATCESMNTYPICDSPPSRSARRCFISLEKLGRNHRSCVWIEALPAMVFVSVQKLSSIVKKVVIDAIVTSNLDYCNSLLYNIPKYQQDRLQRILNTAVCIVCLVPKFNDITPVLCDLHWLPVPNRIQYKILLLVHRVRFRVAIVYLIFKDRVVYNLRSNTSFRSYSVFSNNC